MCSKMFFSKDPSTIGLFLAKFVAIKFKCTVMCALWSCPLNAWKGFPDKAKIFSAAGSIGVGC